MESILKEGRNCWKIQPAQRAAFLVDGAAYFEAFAAAASRATRSILISAWDMDSRVRLSRDKGADTLGDFLNALVRRRKALEVYILVWDFAVIYAGERELFPIFNRPWRKHRRIHFHMDDHHPMGGSQHRKIVVVDDRIAFAGGLDLTRQRWDTPEHPPHDPRRVDPAGHAYEPFHDVQMAVDGDAAAALGDLVREQWRHATGETIPPPEQGREDPWPSALSPDMEDVRVAISRTAPAFEGRPAAREAEALYLDAIASARRFIYMENQYFSSSAVGDAIGKRLQEKDGPDIVMVLRISSDWLEDATMGVFRTRLLERLWEKDRFGRFKVYYPRAEGPENVRINVHSKVMVVDDVLVRVGSSNLSNRSMGVDLECDLAVEALGDAHEKAIASFRDRLLGEHLGMPARQVSETLKEQKSLIKAVENLRGSGRTLVPFPHEEVTWLDGLVPDAVIDPVEPIDTEKIIEEFMSEEIVKSNPNRLRKFILFILALLGLAAAWRWTPLGDWINWDSLTAAGEYLRGNNLGPFIIMGVYVFGSLFMFPITLLILATAFTYGPLAGFLYALLGSLLAAAAGYGVGQAVGRKTVSRIAGSRLNRVSRRLASFGIIAVSSVRIIPVAPFTVVNLVAGASHIRFRDFVLGTTIGMAPGIAAVTLFEHQMERTIRDPGAGSFALLALLAGIIIIAVIVVRRKLLGRKAEG